jgi:hypothetical protein
MAGVKKEILAYLESDVGHVAALSDEAPVSWTPQEGGYQDREVHEEDDENAHIESPKQSMTDFSGESIHGGEGKIKNMDSVPSPEFPAITRSAAFSDQAPPRWYDPAHTLGAKKVGFGSAPQSGQPMKPLEQGKQPTIPGAMQIPQQQQIIMPTKEQLQQIAQFAGQLAAAAEGMKGVVPPNSAVAKMNQQGAIIVKIPLGTNPSLNLDLVKELGDDVEKGLYGNLKIWGLQQYSKVGQVQIQAGAAMKHPNLNKSHFVLAFSMAPGKAPPAKKPDPLQPDPSQPI